MMELGRKFTAEELRNSRPLDRHRISHHPEVKTFLKDFQQRHFPKYGVKRKPLLDVLLMDLYVNWYYHPEMFIGFHRNERAYDKNSRYESLRITKTIIKVVDDLIDAGFIFQQIGFRGEFNSFTSRIKALPPLEEIFEPASFEVLDIVTHEGRETIILKDEDKNEIDYEDTEHTITMRQDTEALNELLQRTHVDLGNRYHNHIERKKGKNQKRASKISITQHNKFVYRVFNNNDWRQGGRYYGGYWQQISKEDRTHLRLNGKRTIEVDYSGIHIMLLYCRKNINYSGADPYTIHIPEINNPSLSRWIAKQVLLTAVNAKDVLTTCAAVRNTIYKDLPEEYELPDIKLSNPFLTSIIDKLRDLHPDIAEFLCTGAGIELQNTDSEIATKIINDFVKDEVPILPVHDSFVVPEDYAPDLREAMRLAFQDVGQVAVTGFTDDDYSIRNAGVALKQEGYLDELYDHYEPDGGAEHQQMLAMKDKYQPATPPHKARFRHFKAWLEKTG
jgi:hypothetical protein